MTKKELEELKENSKKSLEKIKQLSSYGLVFTDRDRIINTLINFNYKITLINTDELSKEDKKQILSYVYDVIITLDDLVNELEKDNQNEIIIKDSPNE